MVKRKVMFSVVVILVFLPAFAVLGKVDLNTGVYLRLRHEYWKDLFDMNNDTKDNRNFFRIKASVWGKFNFGDFTPGGTEIAENTSLFIKLTDEFRAYAHPSTRFDINETVVDNLCLDAKNILGLPVDIRLGRQDMLFTYGEGFLIMDGTPQDGSRTYYFNAAKITWHINNENTLDFVYIHDPAYDDVFPIINESKKPRQKLNTSDEEGYVLYWKNKAIKDTYLEAYYIFKREDDKNGGGIQAQNSSINTFGSYVKYNFDPFVLRGQFAYQFGDYGPYDRDGYGGYVFLDRVFKDVTWKPQVSVGYLYLSGDDKSSNDLEGWDPLFSRWPWMSELYVLSYAPETGTGPGYWTNLSMWRTQLTLTPTKKVKLRFWYNFLRANETVTGSIFNNEKNRGSLYQVRLDYKVNKNVSTYILVEYFSPGDFYAPSNRDEALFTRFEITFKF